MKSKLGLTGIVLTGVLGASGLGGCVGMTSEEENEFINNFAIVTGVMGQMSPYATPGQRMLGAGLEAGGRLQHDKEVAREGKSEVNVNVNLEAENNSYFTQVKLAWDAGQDLVFTCNSYTDKNNDGHISFDEFSGIKNTFTGGESLTVAAHVYNAQGKTFTLKGINLEQKITETKNGGTIPSDNHILYFGSTIIPAGAKCSLRIEAYTDNKLIAYTNCRVVK